MPLAPRASRRRGRSSLTAVLLAFAAILFVLSLAFGVGPDEIAQIPLTADEAAGGFP